MARKARNVLCDEGKLHFTGLSTSAHKKNNKQRNEMLNIRRHTYSNPSPNKIDQNILIESNTMKREMWMYPQILECVLHLNSLQQQKLQWIQQQQQNRKISHITFVFWLCFHSQSLALVGDSIIFRAVVSFVVLLFSFVNRCGPSS